MRQYATDYRTLFPRRAVLHYRTLLYRTPLTLQYPFHPLPYPILCSRYCRPRPATVGDGRRSDGVSRLLFLQQLQPAGLPAEGRVSVKRNCISG